MGSGNMHEQDKENKEVSAGVSSPLQPIKESVSKHLGVPYIYLKKYQKFLCSNGVLFSLEEYKNGIDLSKEYARREKEDKLYDYAYAKSTGLLRKKRGSVVQPSGNEILTQNEQKRIEEVQADDSSKNLSEWSTGKDVNAFVQGEVSSTSGMDKRKEDKEGQSADISRRVYDSADKAEEKQRENNLTRNEHSLAGNGRAVGFIIALLAFTSLISGYISTLQTATYLFDYVDMISAWLMSASVTAYNVTAFEVAVLFKQNRRYGLTFVFITLWVTVTVFSMATAVSVFYDRFNFNEYQIAEENKNVDSNKLALELLQKKEADLREAIAFKKKDIEYRQEHDYATTAVRKELSELETELQENLTAQQNLLSDTPEVTQEVTKRKERLFAFLGRLLKVDSGVFEFTMSTLSAIFVNLIAPLSLVAVAELKKKRLDKSN